VTPTSSSASPRAITISVAAGRSETMRTPQVYGAPVAEPGTDP
jgi:hypothetical protein